MSNFLIFKADFHNSATPAIGTYTSEGGTPYYNRNLNISSDYYLYGDTYKSAICWFVPTIETTDFEFVADILITNFSGRFTYFIIADSTGTTRLRMWSLYDCIYFANDDSKTQDIGGLPNTAVGGFEIFHQFKFRVRKLTDSSSSIEVYIDGTLKLTITTEAALITCAKISFMGGINDNTQLGSRTGIKNTYLYNLSHGDVIDRSVLSGAFNRFISWFKSKLARVAITGSYNDLSNKPTISTVNNAALTIQRNGTNVQTFTANQSTNVTANISVPTKTSDLTNDSGFLTDVAWNDVTNKPSFATVATSGSYNDLTDKPVIPNVSNYYTKAEVDALISNAGISPGTNTLFIGEPYSLANSVETNLGNYEEVSND